MNAVGIVVEYNPFHNGHKYHIQEARKITNSSIVVAVMSGPFLQRGEPAIIDKFSRTATALKNGADIVIELPYAYAVQSSQLFANGAINSLNQLGVDQICFGSESGNIDHFTSTVRTYLQNKHDFNIMIQKEIKKGISYPKAAAKTFHHLSINDIDLNKPNNILGFHYVKTIFENQLAIKPYTIKRINNEYHDPYLTNQISSATSIRNQLLKNNTIESIKNTIPENTYFHLKNYYQKSNKWHALDNYFSFIYYKLLSTETDDLKKLHLVDEGIENKLKKNILQSNSMDELLNSLISNRYTRARIQRMFIHLLTNSKKIEINEFIQQPIPYIRLLGMTKNGQNYINHIKSNLDVPIITNLQKKHQNILKLDEKATNVYYAALNARSRKILRKQEFQLPIIY